MLKEHIRRLTAKGQVTVPANVRKKLGLEPGGRIIFRILDDRVEIDRAPMTLEEAFGSVPPLERAENLETLGEQAWQEHAEKVLDEMKGE